MNKGAVSKTEIALKFETEGVALGPILMSADNPRGLKLEVLLVALRAEIEAKTAKLESDDRATAQFLVQNNRRIQSHLRMAEECQRENLRELEKLGPDQGPTGKSRLPPRDHQKEFADAIKAGGN